MKAEALNQADARKIRAHGRRGSKGGIVLPLEPLRPYSEYAASDERLQSQQTSI